MLAKDKRNLMVQPEMLLSVKIKNERKVLDEMKELTYLIDDVQNIFVIINENEEIVHANKLF